MTTRFSAMVSGPAALKAILIAALALAAACDDGGVWPPPGALAWVATDPVQCLGNAWEQDWLARHGNDYGSYPRDLDSQKTIIVRYYAKFGVSVKEIESIVKFPVTCLACTCPRGDTLYLLVPEDDANTMIFLGYRREDPEP